MHYCHLVDQSCGTNGPDSAFQGTLPLQVPTPRERSPWNAQDFRPRVFRDREVLGGAGTTEGSRLWPTYTKLCVYCWYIHYRARQPTPRSICSARSHLSDFVQEKSLTNRHWIKETRVTYIVKICTIRISRHTEVNIENGVTWVWHFEFQNLNEFVPHLYLVSLAKTAICFPKSNIYGILFFYKHTLQIQVISNK